MKYFIKNVMAYMMIEIYSPSRQSIEEKNLYLILANLMRYVGLSNEMKPKRMRLFYVSKLDDGVLVEVTHFKTICSIQLDSYPRVVISNCDQVYFDSDLEKFSTINVQVDEAIGADMMVVFMLARQLFNSPLH